MKRLISTLLLVCLMAFVVCAQECNTGPSSCAVLTNLPPWFSPVSDSIPPAVNNTPYTIAINIHIPDSIIIGAQSFRIDSLHFDTIANLPVGLCWETSDSNNTFANGQNGCIAITGIATATPGQYKLYIATEMYIPNKVHVVISSSVFAARYLRANCDSPGIHIRAIDTTGTAAGTTFWAYQQSCDSSVCQPCAVNYIAPSIYSLNISPNPFTNQAVVTFNSAKSGMMTERITTVIGTEVCRNPIDVTYGANTHIINRGNLAAGIYFYNISDGITTISQKLIIPKNE